LKIEVKTRSERAKAICGRIFAALRAASLTAFAALAGGFLSTSLTCQVVLLDIELRAVVTLAGHTKDQLLGLVEP
jgi:hypothetical protein